MITRSRFSHGKKLNCASIPMTSGQTRDFFRQFTTYENTKSTSNTERKFKSVLTWAASISASEALIITSCVYCFSGSIYQPYGTSNIFAKVFAKISEFLVAGEMIEWISDRDFFTTMLSQYKIFTTASYDENILAYLPLFSFATSSNSDPYWR